MNYGQIQNLLKISNQNTYSVILPIQKYDKTVYKIKNILKKNKKKKKMIV